jgi:hypothetical protein
VSLQIDAHRHHTFFGHRAQRCWQSGGSAKVELRRQLARPHTATDATTATAAAATATAAAATAATATATAGFVVVVVVVAVVDAVGVAAALTCRASPLPPPGCVVDAV